MKRTILWERALPALGLVAAFVLVSLGIVSQPAAASGIVVNSASDNVANDGTCTLREAIIAANTDTASGATAGECAAGSGTDAITFDANYTITLDGSQLPAVTTAITITGKGAANTIIQASTCNPVTLPGNCTPVDYRVFLVAYSNLALDGVTVRHGRCESACEIHNNLGGGIMNVFGTLTVTNSTVSGNSAAINGGGIYVDNGTATVTNSTLSGNTADFGGGLDSYLGMVTVTSCTISENWANNSGGGLRNLSGTITVTDSTVSGNTAALTGGGIANSYGTQIVTNSTLSGNAAGSNGGGINNYNASLSVSNSILSDNSATLGGGAIYNDQDVDLVTNSVLSGRAAELSGGAISVDDVTVNVANSTLSGNVANEGGSIFNTAGTVAVTSSTISGNAASSQGGGIVNIANGTLAVTNSTLSGNAAGLSAGGITNQKATSVVINSTLTGNLADKEGGGIVNFQGTVTLARSIVSGNNSTKGAEIYQYENSLILADAFNVLGSNGHSTSQAYVNFTPGVGDFNATIDSGSPTALGSILDTTLADNSGLTQTHALVVGSPAIDFGPTASCAAAPVNGVDQRGQSRSFDSNGVPSDNECDSGAFELQPIQPTATPTATALPTATNTVTPTATTTPTVRPQQPPAHRPHLARRPRPARQQSRGTEKSFLPFAIR